MPVRLYTKQQFEDQLKRAGLTPTEARTRLSRLWRAPGGMHVSVPDHSDSYSDIILDDVLRQAGLLYRKPN